VTEFDFVDPRTLPFVEPTSRGELPHLYKDGAWYFVTFRLLDAVVPSATRAARNGKPVDDASAVAGGSAGKTERVKECRATEEAAGIARWADPPTTLGACILRQTEVADLVQKALRHFDGRRYKLAAWCVMPNHVHAIFSPALDCGPRAVLHSWKSFTAHEINRILARQGPIWERESFDHMIRSIEYFEALVRYVEENPVAAGLCDVPESWPWSSARMRLGKARP
jgi:putative transposase